MLQSVDDTAQLTLHPLGTRLAVCYPLLVQQEECSHRSRYVWLTQLFPVEAVPPPWQQAFGVLAHAATGSKEPLPAQQPGQQPAHITCKLPQALQAAAEGQQVRTSVCSSTAVFGGQCPSPASAQLCAASADCGAGCRPRAVGFPHTSPVPHSKPLVLHASNHALIEVSEQPWRQSPGSRGKPTRVLEDTVCPGARADPRGCRVLQGPAGSLPRRGGTWWTECSTEVLPLEDTCVTMQWTPAALYQVLPGCDRVQVPCPCVTTQLRCKQLAVEAWQLTATASVNAQQVWVLAESCVPGTCVSYMLTQQV